MEGTGIIMQSPTQVMEYALAFMFVIFSLTVACCASIMTIIELTMDMAKVKWIDVSFLLTGITLFLVGTPGALMQSFVGTFDLTTGFVTWGIANTVWVIYRAMVSD